MVWRPFPFLTPFPSHPPPFFLHPLSGPAHSASCSCVGEGTATAVVGQMSELWIVTRDSHGNPCASGGENFRLSWRGLGAAAHTQLLDHADGTYEYTYCMNQAGRYTLSVTMGGNPVGGSPFSVHVLPQVALNGPTSQKSSAKHASQAIANGNSTTRRTAAGTVRPRTPSRAGRTLTPPRRHL